MVIESLENSKVKKYTKLQKNKYRDFYNEFIVEGEHLVQEAYISGLLLEVLLLDGTKIDMDIPSVYVTETIMEKISTMPSRPTMIGLCKKIDKNILKGNKILLLDGIQDPGNVGTIIRSARAFNIDTIVMSKDSVDLYNPKVLRATQGIIFHTNIIQDNIIDVISSIKSMNIPIYGTDVVKGKDAVTLTKEEKSKYALIVGNEGNGISDIVKKECNELLHIKTSNKVESLNVAIAASILLYEMER